MGRVLTALSPALMYLYIGVVEVKGLRGYMWLLGRRLYTSRLRGVRVTPTTWAALKTC